MCALVVVLDDHESALAVVEEDETRGLGGRVTDREDPDAAIGDDVLVGAVAEAAPHVAVRVVLDHMHLVADVVGWFPTGSEYTAVNPTRVLDTRDGTGIVPGS